MINWTAFAEWIRQPSTLKALTIVAGTLGYKFSPDMNDQIAYVAGVAYVGLQAFYEKAPRTPKPPDLAKLESELTTEQINEIIKLRKARLEAEKAGAPSK